MKKISLFLALVMLLSVVNGLSFAQESVIKESESGFFYIEANGAQVALSAASADKFIEVDGLYFKDLNGNGKLDVYEDWRADIDTRVADLLSQMTLQEKAGSLGFGGIAGKNGCLPADENNDDYIYSEELVVMDEANVKHASMSYQVNKLYLTTFIAAMTGTPKDQLDLLNKLQSVGESGRLGIPLVFSGDRSYNTWGGMIDMAHYAFGVARDEELLYNLVSEYAKESVALGYHQVFHGYGNEIGSFYGDDVNYIAKMTAIETRAYDDNGFNSHSKHFIARGGRYSYAAGKSPANLIDSWMVGWKAVVDAGTQWIMTNNNIGVTPGLQGYMDKDTYSLLRDDLGYKGIVCLDWPLDAASLMTRTGITSDGIDVSTLTLGQRYTLILDVGVDMFSCYGGAPGTDVEAYTEMGNRYFPDVLVAEIESGAYTEAELDVHVGRVLRNKFDLGIFENPYRDWGAALELIATDAYKAEQFELMSNDDINRARRSEITEMEEELMVKSTILLKNDSILPLQKGVKLYVDSNNEGIKTEDKAALAAYATVVESFAEADACVFHITAFDDAYTYMIEDAQEAGKPVILIIEATNNSGEPTVEQLLSSSAFIMQNYRNTPDHGSSIGSFYRYVKPSITADMLFGVKEPAGSTLFEIGYATNAKALSWGELQNDIGVDNATRLYMAMLAKENPTIDMPNNLGDVICTTNYGMSYSNPAAIELSLLTVPMTTITTETETNGRVRVSTVVVNAPQKAGVPFEINFVAKNNGGGGHVTVDVLDGDAVIAQKFVALAEGQFRVISIELALEASEHVISVGGMTTTIVVE